jgi:hypothetical protein
MSHRRRGVCRIVLCFATSCSETWEALLCVWSFVTSGRVLMWNRAQVAAERAGVRTARTDGCSRNAVSLHVPAIQLYPFFLPVRRKRKNVISRSHWCFSVVSEEKTMAQNYVNGQFNFVHETRVCRRGLCLSIVPVDWLFIWFSGRMDFQGLTQ